MDSIFSMIETSEPAETVALKLPPPEEELLITQEKHEQNEVKPPGVA